MDTVFVEHRKWNERSSIGSLSDTMGRLQGSIDSLPVRRVAWRHEYRLEAYATLSVRNAGLRARAR